MPNLPNITVSPHGYKCMYRPIYINGLINFSPNFIISDPCQYVPPLITVQSYEICNGGFHTINLFAQQIFLKINGFNLGNFS
jgi:hypothetical protein